MKNTRLTVAAVTLAVLMPLTARGQDVPLIGKRGGKAVQGGVGVLSVTVDLAKGGKVAFTATDVSYSWKAPPVSYSTQTSPAAGGVTSEASMAGGRVNRGGEKSPITLTAELGDWSAKLYQAAETGDYATNVSIDLGAGRTLTLTSVKFSSVQLGTDAGGRVVQQVSFIALGIEMK